MTVSRKELAAALELTQSTDAVARSKGLLRLMDLRYEREATEAFKRLATDPDPLVVRSLACVLCDDGWMPRLFPTFIALLQHPNPAVFETAAEVLEASCNKMRTMSVLNDRKGRLAAQTISDPAVQVSPEVIAKLRARAAPLRGAFTEFPLTSLATLLQRVLEGKASLRAATISHPAASRRRVAHKRNL